MGFLLTLILAAPPTPCEKIWPAVWDLYSATELSTGRVPAYVRIPEGKERIARAWIAQCRSFDTEAIQCAQGATQETRVRMLRGQLEGRMTAQELDQVIARFREQWSLLECPEVSAALTLAIDAVMREVRDAGVPRSDAGVPRSDDCAGAELASGKCQCAHKQCMDSCCPEGWACAHSGAAQAKCVKPR